MYYFFSKFNLLEIFVFIWKSCVFIICCICPQLKQIHGSTYNAEEYKYILELTNMHLPISDSEWEHIAQLFNSIFEGNGTKMTLQQKFHKLALKKKCFPFCSWMYHQVVRDIYRGHIRWRKYYQWRQIKFYKLLFLHHAIK